MSKHTKGPWEVYHDTYHDTWSVEGDGDTLADLWRMSEETHSRHPHYEDEAEANARLIAAAPSMYEFIKRQAASGNSDAKEIIDTIG